MLSASGNNLCEEVVVMLNQGGTVVRETGLKHLAQCKSPN